MLFYERVRHLGDKILRVPCVGYTDSLWLWTLLTCGVGMGWAVSLWASLGLSMRMGSGEHLLVGLVWARCSQLDMAYPTL